MSTSASASASATTSPPPKRAKTDPSDPSGPAPPYELYYWPGIPGRGEFIRLCFEATGTAYTDITTAPPASSGAGGGGGPPPVVKFISPTNKGTAHSPPPLAPPVLKHGDLILSQTPNILLYLAPRLGLAGDTTADPNGIYTINSLALTALDGLSNEVHDTHHPIAIALYYEDQATEARRRAADYINTRLPKFLGYFARVLASPSSQGGKWLYGGQMTYADLVLWQGVDGVKYAFPKAMERLEEGGEFGVVFEHYDRVAREVEGVRKYLESGRRKEYGLGIWRRYEELNLVPEK